MVISLTRGLSTLVDNDDYKNLWKHRWCITAGYASRCINGKIVYMHRLITKAPKGSWVDHINHNKLDNRKSNLRICFGHEKYLNRSKRTKISKYKGVQKHGNKFHSKITFKNKVIYLGGYKTDVEAAMVYDKKARELHGKFANINFCGDK